MLHPALLPTVMDRRDTTGRPHIMTTGPPYSSPQLPYVPVRQKQGGRRLGRSTAEPLAAHVHLAAARTQQLGKLCVAASAAASCRQQCSRLRSRARSRGPFPSAGTPVSARTREGCQRRQDAEGHTEAVEQSEGADQLLPVAHAEQPGGGRRGRGASQNVGAFQNAEGLQDFNVVSY